MIDGHRQSHGDIVPKKSPNNSREAEEMEERSPVKGNTQEHPSHRTQSRTEGMQVGAGAHTNRQCQMQRLCVTTQDKNRMRQYRSSGSVRGAARKGCPYLDSFKGLANRNDPEPCADGSNPTGEA